jgi:hypothetical protein
MNRASAKRTACRLFFGQGRDFVRVGRPIKKFDGIKVDSYNAFRNRVRSSDRFVSSNLDWIGER